MLRKILPGLCLLVISSACFGSVITFGDLSGSGIAIPNGYAGFNWNNFDGMTGSFAPVADAAGASSAAQTFAVNHAEQVAFVWFSHRIYIDQRLAGYSVEQPVER